MTVPLLKDLSRTETTMTALVATSAGRTLRTAMFAAVGAAFALSAVPASAQSAASTDSWIKVCRTDEKAKKEICKTAFDLRTSGGQFLASIALLEVSGEARKIVEMILPTNLLLQPGLKVQVDQNKAEEAKFMLCAADGCVSNLTVNDAFVDGLKKGGVKASLRLDGEVICGIFSGQIKLWNDAKIKKLNPGVTGLPAKKIQVVGRSDSSGTTYVFTSYLGKAAAAAQKNCGMQSNFAEIGRAHV